MPQNYLLLWLALRGSFQSLIGFWGFYAGKRLLLVQRGFRVSIPDRVLGFLCLSLPEALMYLAFKVQFRESSTKVSFQPVTCQYQILTVASKPYPAKLTEFP